MPLHCNADRRREVMFTFKTEGTVAKNAWHRMPWKLMFAAVFVACGGFALGIAWATPPVGFTATNIVGPVAIDELDTVHQTPDYGVLMMSRGVSDVYVTHLKIVPGGHGGWHSHPGPSIITVKSGTATFYDECNDFVPQTFSKGTGFVEDAECVHLLANEGSVDLEVVVIQIVPFGAPRRIDEADPRDYALFVLSCHRTSGRRGPECQASPRRPAGPRHRVAGSTSRRSVCALDAMAFSLIADQKRRFLMVPRNEKHELKVQPGRTI